MERVKAALKGSDMAEIKSSSEALTQVWSQIAPSLYQQGAPQGEPQPSAEQSTPQSDDGPGHVEDADYEVVDDKNKK